MTCARTGSQSEPLSFICRTASGLYLGKHQMWERFPCSCLATECRCHLQRECLMLCWTTNLPFHVLETSRPNNAKRKARENEQEVRRTSIGAFCMSLRTGCGFVCRRWGNFQGHPDGDRKDQKFWVMASGSRTQFSAVGQILMKDIWGSRE